MQERYKKALDPLRCGLDQVSSEEYRGAVRESDARARKIIADAPPVSDIRNAHWECLDCHDSWKVAREKVPSRCREFSVRRDGQPSNKPGCGSQNIRRKENVPRDAPQPPGSLSWLEDTIAGEPAYVSGIQLTPSMDWEMGENDEEAEVRAERRQLAINGSHPAFRTADRLDGKETREGTPFEELQATAALTTHVINAGCFAWARWHYEKSKDFNNFLSRFGELKAACLSGIRSSAGAARASAS